MIQMEGKMLCWLCIVAYKRANKKQQKMESLTNCSLSRFSPHVNNTSTPILLGADKKTLKDVSLSANGTPNTAKDGDNAESKFSDSLR